MSRSIRMELPSLAKEGWPRHQVNGPVPLKSARTGWFVQLPMSRWLERTTLPCFALSGSHSLRSCPSAPAKEASPLFLNGRGHPSFAKEGSSIRMLRDISVSLCFHQPDCFACGGQEV